MVDNVLNSLITVRYKHYFDKKISINKDFISLISYIKNQIKMIKYQLQSNYCKRITM